MANNSPLATTRKVWAAFRKDGIHRNDRHGPWVASTPQGISIAPGAGNMQSCLNALKTHLNVQFNVNGAEILIPSYECAE